VNQALASVESGRRDAQRIAAAVLGQLRHAEAEGFLRELLGSEEELLRIEAARALVLIRPAYLGEVNVLALFLQPLAREVQAVGIGALELVVMTLSKVGPAVLRDQALTGRVAPTVRAALCSVIAAVERAERGPDARQRADQERFLRRARTCLDTWNEG
jgi:hypothetical protein